MSGHMKIVDPIYEGAIEPSTKNQLSDGNHSGHSRSMRGICASSKTNPGMVCVGGLDTSCV